MTSVAAVVTSNGAILPVASLYKRQNLVDQEEPTTGEGRNPLLSRLVR